ncbi:MAG: MBL fold metallo-hydrolase [Chlorobiota bacterium]|nr:MBL fold metallo-hydrolase [Chlorobiota bacterium]QQS66509.1 MAG: MBL fold metallo-hydrolase [Chlorobiota bacterium]
MKLSFHGAARTVTGSKHIIHLSSGKKILLDCGLFQGMGKETLWLNKDFGFDPSLIDYVIISHAHIDHIGLLPKLVREGFSGPIFCTEATEDLANIMLIDSARIQEEDARHINKKFENENKVPVNPLYSVEDAQNVFPFFQSIDYNTPKQIDENIELTYSDCGHILGSAAVNLKIKDKGKISRICFSGDIGRYRDIILRSPDVFPQADFIIMESTYGDRIHDDTKQITEELLGYIKNTCLNKKGKLIIPAFSIGRTQELLYALNRLENEGRLPNLKYFVDSPLSMKATQIIKDHPECFNKSVKHLLKTDNNIFGFRDLHFIETVEESKALNQSNEPCVIISASGMAEAGRVKHHIEHNIDNNRNTILIVGYCEPLSLGGRLCAGAPYVKIYGEEHQVKADVGVIKSMSAHGDYDDLCQWLACQNPQIVKKLFLVHGDFESQENFKSRLIKKGFLDVEIPFQHQVIGLG